MAELKKTKGAIIWQDLTVPNAEEVRDFYSQVAGWTPSPVDMGGYSDFNMIGAEEGVPVAGICHTRGVNAEVPPQWMIYIAVEDLDAAAERCVELGGKVLMSRGEGEHRMCVIQDPAGAVATLYPV